MSKEPFDGLVINGYGIYTPSDQKNLKAYIAKIETEARIATLKEVDDRLCELHQKTEGAAMGIGLHNPALGGLIEAYNMASHPGIAIQRFTAIEEMAKKVGSSIDKASSVLFKQMGPIVTGKHYIIVTGKQLDLK